MRQKMRSGRLPSGQNTPSLNSQVKHLRCTLRWELLVVWFFVKILFICRERRRKRGKETSMGGCSSHTLNWGPGPQP